MRASWRNLDPAGRAVLAGRAGYAAPRAAYGVLMRSSTSPPRPLAFIPAARVDGAAGDAVQGVAGEVTRRLAALGPVAPVVFACVGTDRSTGDALGPLVGEQLAALGCPADRIVGTLAHPLHALNVEGRMAALAESAPGARVIAVDAALGRAADVGGLLVRTGGIRPGLGVGKELGPIGDVSVTATVNVAGTSMDSQVLQSTRLFLVQRLAHAIGLGLWLATGPDQAPGEPLAA